MAESTLFGLCIEALEAVQHSVHTKSRHFTGIGTSLRWIRSILVPGDGLILCLFEATDAIAIRDFYEAAELPLTRIVEARESYPSYEDD